MDEKPYEPAFAVGAQLQVAPLAVLEHFRSTWRFHNPLQPEQLEFAGRAAVVESVGFYHGGDVLYVLRGIPGVWHEACLRRP